MALPSVLHTYIPPRMFNTKRITVFLVLLLTLISHTEGTSKVFIKFIDYVNPSSLDYDGQCCDGELSANGTCTAVCDYIIKVCMGSSSLPCSYIETNLGYVKAEGSNIDFPTTFLDGHANPVPFSFEDWHGSTLITIYVFDQDTYRKEYVDTVSVDFQMARPNNTGMLDLEYQAFNLTGTRLTQPSRMTLAIAFRCDQFYYGDSCDVKCLPSDDCNGHYTCDVTDGHKTCLDGWGGEDCDVALSSDHGCPREQCSNHGTCITYNNRTDHFYCCCQEGYVGDTCSSDVDECAAFPCLHGGQCVQVGPPGFVCRCSAWWKGPLCEQSVTCDDNPCQNGGQCKRLKQLVQESFYCDCDKRVATGDLCENIVTTTSTTTTTTPTTTTSTTTTTTTPTTTPTPTTTTSTTTTTTTPTTTTSTTTTIGTPTAQSTPSTEIFPLFTTQKYTSRKPNESLSTSTPTTTDASTPLPLTSPLSYTEPQTSTTRNPATPITESTSSLTHQTSKTSLSSPPVVIPATFTPSPSPPPTKNPYPTLGCFGHYYGQDCTKYCRPADDCSGHFRCNQTTGDKVCLHGWMGRDCREPVIRSSNCLCQNEGVCLGEDSTTCCCGQSHTGPLCKTPSTFCSSNPCVNGGECFDGACHCREGFTGRFCQRMLYPNRNCRKGFYGPTCDVFCLPETSCGNSQYTCDELTGRRVCGYGFAPPNCNEIDLNSKHSIPCPASACRNGGVCNDGVCCCPIEFTGSLCQIRILPCQSSPCLNDGVCRNLLPGYNCTCKPGYMGLNCEYLVGTSSVLQSTTVTPQSNMCSSNPCHSNGRCVQNGMTDFVCVCHDGTVGDTCQDHVTNTNRNTTCPQHMYGESCNVYCKDKDDCQGHYYCNLYGHKTCMPGWGGEYCHLRTLDPELDPYCPEDGTACLNNGQCFRGSCCCDVSHKGDRCQEEILPCASNPCGNLGKCSDQDGGFYCNCFQGYSGKSCEYLFGTGTSTPTPLPISTSISTVEASANSTSTPPPTTTTPPPTTTTTTPPPTTTTTPPPATTIKYDPNVTTTCSNFVCYNGGECFYTSLKSICRCPFPNMGTYCQLDPYPPTSTTSTPPTASNTLTSTQLTAMESLSTHGLAFLSSTTTVTTTPNPSDSHVSSSMPSSTPVVVSVFSTMSFVEEQSKNVNPLSSTSSSSSSSSTSSSLQPSASMQIGMSSRSYTTPISHAPTTSSETIESINPSASIHTGISTYSDSLSTMPYPPTPTQVPTTSSTPSSPSVLIVTSSSTDSSSPMPNPSTHTPLAPSVTPVLSTPIGMSGYSITPTMFNPPPLTQTVTRAMQSSSAPVGFYPNSHTTSTMPYSSSNTEDTFPSSNTPTPSSQATSIFPNSDVSSNVLSSKSTDSEIATPPTPTSSIPVAISTTFPTPTMSKPAVSPLETGTPINPSMSTPVLIFTVSDTSSIMVDPSTPITPTPSTTPLEMSTKLVTSSLASSTTPMTSTTSSTPHPGKPVTSPGPTTPVNNTLEGAFYIQNPIHPNDYQTLIQMVTLVLRKTSPDDPCCYRVLVNPFRNITFVDNNGNPLTTVQYRFTPSSSDETFPTRTRNDTGIVDAVDAALSTTRPFQTEHNRVYHGVLFRQNELFNVAFVGLMVENSYGVIEGVIGRVWDEHNPDCGCTFTVQVRSGRMYVGRYGTQLTRIMYTVMKDDSRQAVTSQYRPGTRTLEHALDKLLTFTSVYARDDTYPYDYSHELTLNARVVAGSKECLDTLEVIRTRWDVYRRETGRCDVCHSRLQPLRQRTSYGRDGNVMSSVRYFVFNQDRQLLQRSLPSPPLDSFRGTARWCGCENKGVRTLSVGGDVSYDVIRTAVDGAVGMGPGSGRLIRKQLGYDSTRKPVSVLDYIPKDFDAPLVPFSDIQESLLANDVISLPMGLPVMHQYTVTLEGKVTLQQSQNAVEEVVRNAWILQNGYSNEEYVYIEPKHIEVQMMEFDHMTFVSLQGDPVTVVRYVVTIDKVDSSLTVAVPPGGDTWTNAFLSVSGSPVEGALRHCDCKVSGRHWVKVRGQMEPSNRTHGDFVDKALARSWKEANPNYKGDIIVTTYKISPNDTDTDYIPISSIPRETERIINYTISLPGATIGVKDNDLTPPSKNVMNNNFLAYENRGVDIAVVEEKHDDDDDDDDDDFPWYIPVGIILAIILTFLIILIVCCILRDSRRKNSKHINNDPDIYLESNFDKEHFTTEPVVACENRALKDFHHRNGVKTKTSPAHNYHIGPQAHEGRSDL